MSAVIPPKKNRTTQRPYDEDLYKLRHLVENAFLHLKRWHGIATATPKTPHPSSLPSTSDASLSGSMSRDYTI